MFKVYNLKLILNIQTHTVFISASESTITFIGDQKVTRSINYISIRAIIFQLQSNILPTVRRIFKKHKFT